MKNQASLESDRDRTYHMLSAWRTASSTRVLVYLFVGTSVLDVIFTYLLVDRMGTMGEVNLVTRWLLELNMLPIWACMAVFASFLCSAILGSGCIVMRSKRRMMSTILFSTAISTRIGTNVYMAALYLGFEQLTTILLPLGLIVFILTWRTLSGIRISEEIAHLQTSKKTSLRGSAKWRIIKAVSALILVPFVTLGFLQILMSFSGVENLPRWLRSLGVVTELQGRIFLVGLVAVIVMIAAMIYAVLTLLEFLTKRGELEETTNKVHIGV
jgi:hypothetical protein